MINQLSQPESNPLILHGSIISWAVRGYINIPRLWWARNRNEENRQENFFCNSCGSKENMRSSLRLL